MHPFPFLFKTGWAWYFHIRLPVLLSLMQNLYTNVNHAKSMKPFAPIRPDEQHLWVIVMASVGDR